MTRKLSWPKVRNGFQNFAQMEGKGEMAWFHKTWDCLRRDGLTEYDDESGRVRAALYAWILGTIWADFYDLLWDGSARESREHWFLNDLAALGIKPVSLLPLAQAECGFAPVNDPPARHDVWSAARRLKSKHLSAISASLYRGFGGDDNLITAMYRACVPEQDQQLTPDAREFVELGFVLPWEFGAESAGD